MLISLIMVIISPDLCIPKHQLYDLNIIFVCQSQYNWRGKKHKIHSLQLNKYFNIQIAYFFLKIKIS